MRSLALLVLLAVGVVTTDLREIEEDILLDDNEHHWGVNESCFWLSNIVRLPQYKKLFVEHEVDGHRLMEMTDQLLVELGVHVRSHRRMILKHIVRLAIPSLSFTFWDWRSEETFRAEMMILSLMMCPRLSFVYLYVFENELLSCFFEDPGTTWKFWLCMLVVPHGLAGYYAVPLIASNKLIITLFLYASSYMTKVEFKAIFFRSEHERRFWWWSFALPALYKILAHVLPALLTSLLFYGILAVEALHMSAWALKALKAFILRQRAKMRADERYTEAANDDTTDLSGNVLELVEKGEEVIDRIRLRHRSTRAGSPSSISAPEPKVPTDFDATASMTAPVTQSMPTPPRGRTLEPPKRAESFSAFSFTYSAPELDRVNRADLTVHEALGKGGFAEVHRATYQHADVALKVFASIASESQVESFFKEVSALANLRHPNIVLFMGFCVDYKDGGQSVELGLLMEYLPHNLNSLLHSRSRKKSLGRRQRLRILLDVAKGLSYLHGKKIAHRDVKPANLIVDPQRMIAKLVDFGLAGLSSMEAGGYTKRYAAPEILLKQCSCHMPADMYSYGLVVFETLVDAHPRPFASSDRENVFAAPFGIDTASALGYGFPGAGSDCITRCWGPSPEARSTAPALIGTLRSALDSSWCEDDCSSEEREHSPRHQVTNDVTLANNTEDNTVTCD